MKTLQEVFADKKRTYILFFLLISVLVLLSIMAYNKDTLFKTVEKVTYRNNCTEIYVNGELNSSPCPNSEFNKRYPMPDINIPMPILTDET